jgi:hypothetical protein
LRAYMLRHVERESTLVEPTFIQFAPKPAARS